MTSLRRASKKVPLRDVAFFQEGPGLRTHQWATDGIKVINVTNIIGDGCVDVTNTDKFVALNEFEARYAHFAVEENDIVVASSGNTYGKVGRIRPEHLPLMMNTSVIRFHSANEALLDDDFLYAWLRSPEFINQVEGFVTGGAQPNFGPTHLKQMSITLPEIHVQKRMANILSAYDYLIENNRRRMAVLEEAARQLYREWFVRLRFPGHEHTRITKGMPEGWREVRFEEVLVDLESGGRPRGGATDTDGVPSIGAENVLGIGQYDYSKEKFVPKEYFEKMARGVVRNRDVVLYKDGANVGRASYFGEGFPHEKCAVNEHVFILRTKPFVGQSFLYFWMIRDENRQAIANLNANTAQPGISQEKLKGLRLVLPHDRLTRAFHEAVDPQVKQIFGLALINQKLRAARDLLLPRLMTGNIAV